MTLKSFVNIKNKSRFRKYLINSNIPSLRARYFVIASAAKQSKTRLLRCARNDWRSQ